MKGRGFGLLGNMVVGIVGAFLGGFLFGILGLASYGLIGSLVTATVGAVVLLFLISVVKRTNNNCPSNLKTNLATRRLVVSRCLFCFLHLT